MVDAFTSQLDESNPVSGPHVSVPVSLGDALLSVACTLQQVAWTLLCICIYELLVTDWG